MRQDIENIYKILPLCNDVKFNIYTQLYKNNTISKILKNDLLTYVMLNNIIHTYQIALGKDNIDKHYFLYSLYNDLIHEHYIEKMDLDVDMDNDLLFYSYYYDSAIIDSQYYDYPFLIKRIKYYWKILSPITRKKFKSYMMLKLQL